MKKFAMIVSQDANGLCLTHTVMLKDSSEALAFFSASLKRDVALHEIKEVKQDEQ